MKLHTHINGRVAIGMDAIYTVADVEALFAAIDEAAGELAISPAGLDDRSPLFRLRAWEALIRERTGAERVMWRLDDVFHIVAVWEVPA